MACEYFFVNESAQKTVPNRNRNAERRTKKARAKFVRVAHHQPEFNTDERELQDKVGVTVTCAQIAHFARKLREIADDDVPLKDGGIVYRVFVDRRWDSLPGIVHAMRMHGGHCVIHCNCDEDTSIPCDFWFEKTQYRRPQKLRDKVQGNLKVVVVRTHTFTLTQSHTHTRTTYHRCGNSVGNIAQQPPPSARKTTR